MDGRDFPHAASAPRKSRRPPRSAKRTCARALEAFEPRILFQISPFTIAGNGKSATFTDVDGDQVTMTVSVGTLTTDNFVGAFTGVGNRAQCQMVFLTLGDFNGHTFDGANITFTVARAAGGDGLVNIGSIFADSHDLGNITIPGDLGKIEAGADTAGVPGVKSLSVHSMGRFGVDTQGAEPDLLSVITGGLGALTISGDMKDAFLNVTSGVASQGTIGALTVGGSIIGGAGVESGAIRTTGSIGRITIGGDLIGGTGANSGRIITDGAISSVTIGGSLIGGGGDNSACIQTAADMGAVRIAANLLGGGGAGSGVIRAGLDLKSIAIGDSVVGGAGLGSALISTSLQMGRVQIGHDLQGGTADESGFVTSGGDLARVTIGGSLLGGEGQISGSVQSMRNMGGVRIGGSLRGGSGAASGQIFGSNLTNVTIGGSLSGGDGGGSGYLGATGNIGRIRINGDFTGANVTGSASLDASGFIYTQMGRIASIFIGGSIIAGVDTSSGTLTRSASIQAGGEISSLTVHGNIIGNAGPDGFTPVIISAMGHALATSDVAIGTLSVGGRVEYARILAGIPHLVLEAADGDAQIGSVSVGGDWIASSLAAGVSNDNSANTLFGNSGDASIGPGNPDIVASIGNIAIGGQVLGSPLAVNNSDVFGFVAQQIKHLTVGGVAVALSAGAHNDNFAPFVTADDVFVHEV